MKRLSIIIIALLASVSFVACDAASADLQPLADAQALEVTTTASTDNTSTFLDTTASATNAVTTVSYLPVFSLEELATYTGAGGTAAYIAVDGIVYDITSVFPNGMHQGIQLGGTDCTSIFASSPHSASTLSGLPVVGSLEGYAEIPAGPAPVDNNPAPVPVELDQATMDYYINLIETYMSGSVLSVTSAVSDNPDYETMVTVEVLYYTGTVLTYQLYYSETAPAVDPIVATTTISENPDDDCDLDHEGTEDGVLVSQINGILIVGDTTYALTGDNYQTTDGNEYVLNAAIDENNYLAIIFENETSKQSLMVKEVTDGAVISTTGVKVETDENATVTDFRMDDGTSRIHYTLVLNQPVNEGDAVTGFMLIHDDTTGLALIKVDINVDPTTGEYVYTFLQAPANPQGDDDHEGEHQGYQGEDDDEDEDHPASGQYEHHEGDHHEDGQHEGFGDQDDENESEIDD